MNKKIKYILEIVIYAIPVIVIGILSIIYVVTKEKMDGASLFFSGIASLMTSLLLKAIIDNICENGQNEVSEYYKDAKAAVSRINIVYNIPDDKKVGKNEKNKEKETTDIIELMLLNMKEIKEYYVLSKTMAKRSFLLSVIMCIFGFVIISGAAMAIFVTDVSLVQLIIPVIGGTIVEVIAATTLVVYRKSLDQLNQYYESLHNNERFLSLVNLVDKISDDKKDQTYINIINTQLEGLKSK